MNGSINGTINGSAPAPYQKPNGRADYPQTQQNGVSSNGIMYQIQEANNVGSEEDSDDVEIIRKDIMGKLETEIGDVFLQSNLQSAVTNVISDNFLTMT